MNMAGPDWVHAAYGLRCPGFGCPLPGRRPGVSGASGSPRTAS